MRILYILFFSLMFSFSVYSQDGLIDRAKKISDEMSMVLSLDEETSEKVIKLLENLDDLDDVQNVHSNAEFIDNL